MAGQAKIEQLYNLAKKSVAEKTPPPKGRLFSTKCPKCGSKLNKETVKEFIFATEGAGSEFANRIVTEAGFKADAYDLRVKHFNCSNCGYDFAESSLNQATFTCKL